MHEQPQDEPVDSKELDKQRRAYLLRSVAAKRAANALRSQGIDLYGDPLEVTSAGETASVVTPENDDKV